MNLLLKCLFVAIGCLFIGKGILANNYTFAFIALFVMAALTALVPTSESKEENKKNGLYF
jgi:hypothetical protein